MEEACLGPDAWPLTSSLRLTTCGALPTAAAFDTCFICAETVLSSLCSMDLSLKKLFNQTGQSLETENLNN